MRVVVVVVSTCWVSIRGQPLIFLITEKTTAVGVVYLERATATVNALSSCTGCGLQRAEPDRSGPLSYRFPPDTIQRGIGKRTSGKYVPLP